jgi:acylphosphatase
VSPPEAIRHVIFHGRVQGVGFRAFVEGEALARGLGGWVRNRRDGSVEAVFAGLLASVAEATDACMRGPPSARVERLDVKDSNADQLALRQAGERFSVLPTV